MLSSSHAAHFPPADESVQPPAVVFFIFFSEETERTTAHCSHALLYKTCDEPQSRAQ